MTRKVLLRRQGSGFAHSAELGLNRADWGGFGSGFPDPDSDLDLDSGDCSVGADPANLVSDWDSSSDSAGSVDQQMQRPMDLSGQHPWMKGLARSPEDHSVTKLEKP